MTRQTWTTSARRQGSRLSGGGNIREVVIRYTETESDCAVRADDLEDDIKDVEPGGVGAVDDRASLRASASSCIPRRAATVERSHSPR